jgi:hypothetical protein
MSAEIGVAVSDILDRAARKHIGQDTPDAYDQFLWQVHGAGTVRHYDGSDAYWRRVLAALDSFFTAEQRVEILHRLAQWADLAGCPEGRRLRALALTEARVAELVADVAHMTAACRTGAQRARDSVDRPHR